MSTREVIGALPFKSVFVTHRVRYDGERDVKRRRTGEKHGTPRLVPGMPGRHTRNLIRVLVGAALCAALSASLAAPIPEDLPAIAIRQPGLYQLEVALLVFYGWLLLLTPAFSGLIRGRLPIEISTRGARFAEEAGQSATQSEQRTERLERTVKAHAEELATVILEIKRLKGLSDCDSTEPEVDSRR